jgi:uncharacterized protein
MRHQVIFNSLIGCVSALIATSCADLSPAEARRELGALGIEYSQDSFARTVSRGDSLAVRLFLIAGMDPNAKDDTGYPALWHAVTRRDKNISTMLIAHGADVAAWTPAGRSSLCEVLEMHNDAEVIRIVRGAPGAAAEELRCAVRTKTRVQPNAGRQDPPTPSAEVALMNGADPNQRLEFNRTPLMVALANEQWDVARQLIRSGADVNALDDGGNTPLIFAVDRFSSGDVLEQLIGKGANVNIRNHRGWTPLMAAVHRSNRFAVRTLLKHGANARAYNEVEGFSPLLIAADKLNPVPEILLLLMEHGARPSDPGLDGLSILETVRASNRGDMERLLTDREYLLSEIARIHGGG